MSDLATAFVAALASAKASPGAAAPLDPVSLQAHLQQLYARAAASSPTYHVPPLAFVEHVATRLDPVPTTADGWNAVAAADLYLACACTKGDPRALAAFERQYAAAVTRKAEKMVRQGVTADEVRQHVWHKLFVGLRGAAPRIGEYTGRGPLLGWLNVITARTAIDLGRAAGSGSTKDLGEGLLALQHDPELDFLKRQYRDAFGDALREAITTLDAKQRGLLAYQVIEGLDTNQIGQIYGVHRTSAGRWLGEAREALLAQTRRILMRSLDVTRDDFDSIMRLIGSRLDVTLRHLLRPGSPTDGEQA